MLEEILNFDNKYAIRGITDEELYHFHKRYEKFKIKTKIIIKILLLELEVYFLLVIMTKEQINQQITEKDNSETAVQLYKTFHFNKKKLLN